MWLALLPGSSHEHSKISQWCVLIRVSSSQGTHGLTQSETESVSFWEIWYWCNWHWLLPPVCLPVGALFPWPCSPLFSSLLPLPSVCLVAPLLGKFPYWVLISRQWCLFHLVVSLSCECSIRSWLSETVSKRCVLQAWIWVSSNWLSFHSVWFCP